MGGDGAERVGLRQFTVGLAFAVPVAVAEGRDILSQQFYYTSWAMYVGVLGSIATIAVSALAELVFLAHTCIGEFRLPD
jgi:hypothetical protein